MSDLALTLKTGLTNDLYAKHFFHNPGSSIPSVLLTLITVLSMWLSYLELF